MESDYLVAAGGKTSESPLNQYLVAAGGKTSANGGVITTAAGTMAVVNIVVPTSLESINHFLSSESVVTLKAAFPYSGTIDVPASSLKLADSAESENVAPKAEPKKPKLPSLAKLRTTLNERHEVEVGGIELIRDDSGKVTGYKLSCCCGGFSYDSKNMEPDEDPMSEHRAHVFAKKIAALLKEKK